MDNVWNVKQYLKFEEERRRPVVDLLARAALQEPKAIADLGCGPGHLTAELAERWPNTRVYGMDSSPQMIENAQKYAVSERINFELADIMEWKPPQLLDFALCNAVLQWVPDHMGKLGNLMDMLGPRGVLAIQVPHNSEDAMQNVILKDVVQDRRWRHIVGQVFEERDYTMSPEQYVDAFAKLGFVPDVWETTYMHILQGDDAPYEWRKGTALRPFDHAFGSDDKNRKAFFDEYCMRMRDAFPQQSYGTVFPFQRIFIIVRKP